MKSSCLRSLALVYPEGVEKHQWRDAIRIFIMGWLDAIIHFELFEAVERCIEETELIADYNWWPDESWRWW